MDFVEISKVSFGEAVAAAAPRAERDAGKPGRSFRNHLVGCLGEVAFQDAVNAWGPKYPPIA